MLAPLGTDPCVGLQVGPHLEAGADAVGDRGMPKEMAMLLALNKLRTALPSLQYKTTTHWVSVQPWESGHVPVSLHPCVLVSTHLILRGAHAHAPFHTGPGHKHC